MNPSATQKLTPGDVRMILEIAIAASSVLIPSRGSSGSPTTRWTSLPTRAERGRRRALPW